MTPRPMIVAGIMSGTSADGIDVALVRISARNRLKLKFLAHESFPYSPSLRRSVLAAMNAVKTSTAELARLNWRLGLAYADTVQETIRRHPARLDLIGCHGQTLFHQGLPSTYAGKSFTLTWQAGESAAIASALSVPVVSNFRPADMFAGGQGAPLVPFLDYAYFSHVTRGRILQNIGGIGNLTAIPAGSSPDRLLAFDTGPGNMIIDTLTQKLFGKPYDRNGAIAARGIILLPVLKQALKDPYFALRPPRSAGREQFGREYSANFLARCRLYSRKPQDALATATAFTAESIVHSYAQFVRRKMKGAPVDYIVSGGGAKNATLMRMLTERLASMDCTVVTTEQFGLPTEAKEAAAFALLAWLTWHQLPGNVPSATGARRPVILGQVAYAP